MFTLFSIMVPFVISLYCAFNNATEPVEIIKMIRNEISKKYKDYGKKSFKQEKEIIISTFCCLLRTAPCVEWKEICSSLFLWVCGTQG